MPYETTWKSRGVVWTYTGLVSGSDLLQSNLEIYGDPRFDDLAYQVVDFSEAEGFAIDETHMRKIAHLDMAAARTNSRVVIAVIANSERAREITAIYEKYATESPWKLRTFKNADDARAWLRNELKHRTLNPFAPDDRATRQ